MSEWTFNRVSSGDTILERYDVVSVLGENEIGVSCLVTDRTRQQNYLFCQLAFECTPERVAQIRDVVGHLKKINHKSVASLYDFMVDGSTGYVSMEYIEGETLASHIQMRRDRGQILGQKAAYSFIAHLCAGLELFHQNGYSFGALTPQNIYVTNQGRVKIASIILGFLADTCLDDARRQTYFSDPFVAPEVRESRGASAKPSDVFSLALLFSELLSSAPFASFGSSPETFVASLPGVSSTVKETLFSAISASLSDRLADVQMLKEALKAAVEAPSDNDLSSIVMGVADLRALSASTDMPVIDPGRSQAQKLDLFDRNISGGTPSLCRRLKKDVWIYQKDGIDYGPFSAEGILEKLYADEIHEKTMVLHTMTKEKFPLEEIPEFSEQVKAYLPVRARNMETKRALERKKKRQATGALATLITIPLLIFLGISGVSWYMIQQMATPEPLAFNDAFAPFEKKFEPPKEEEVSLNLDDKDALALFDPKASAKEREAAMAAYEAEHRKKYEALRRKLNAGRKAPGAGGDDGIDEIVFALDENGQEIAPLQDWEIDEQVRSPRALRKQSDCFVRYSNGRAQKITVNFTIEQSGSVQGLRTSAQGELNTCLVDAFSSLKFRKFGGTRKRVSYPIVFN